MKLSMPRNRRTYLIAGLVVLLVLVFIIARGGTEVEMVQVQPGSITRTVVDTGYVQAATDYELYATQSARVAETPVEAGQAVQPGQTLVVLENLDLSMQISEARSQLSQANAAVAAARIALRTAQLELEQARENRERIKQLLDAGGATPVEYERAQVQVETLEQQLGQQSVNLENSRQQVASINSLLQQLAAKEQQLVVKSPIAGVLLSCPVETGQVLMPGALLAKV
ncbi:MAG: biotin/lipoyl-binding protein, partial [Syntrophomonadaceae bacterium]|nr:biotin/lipoyl-binding protein [Syntrophomonadaceae bacterium]